MAMHLVTDNTNFRNEYSNDKTDHTLNRISGRISTCAAQPIVISQSSVFMEENVFR